MDLLIATINSQHFLDVHTRYVVDCRVAAVLLSSTLLALKAINQKFVENRAWEASQKHEVLQEELSLRTLGIEVTHIANGEALGHPWSPSAAKHVEISRVPTR